MTKTDAVCFVYVVRGYNIGVRLVDEFLAKSGVTNCQDFKDTADVVAKVAFKMFLGINVDVSQWNTEGTACSLFIYDNPLTGRVECLKSFELKTLFSMI